MRWPRIKYFSKRRSCCWACSLCPLISTTLTLPVKNPNSQDWSSSVERSGGHFVNHGCDVWSAFVFGMELCRVITPSVASVHRMRLPRKTSFRSGLIKSRPTYMQFRQIKRRRVGELDHLPTVSLQHCLNTWNVHALLHKGTELRPLCAPVTGRTCGNSFPRGWKKANKNLTQVNNIK